MNSLADNELTFLEMFESINTDLLQYSGESQPLYDELLSAGKRYSKGAVINRGGMKEIIKTTDSMTGREVAKAVLIDFEDPVKKENFLREARITAALEHPNIIPVYDVGVDDDEGPFFTMKLVGGRSLADILQQMSVNERDYSLRDLINIFLKICDAVDYAHSKGILHLDLKPENIQVDDYGEVLICDWGIAKIMECSNDDLLSGFETELDPVLYNDVTLHGYIKGTPGFMAPEQIKPELGDKDQRTDIFALGGILYNLLTLKPPCQSSRAGDILNETLEGKVTPPCQRVKDRLVPSSLDAVTMKALSVNPDDRYSAVSELKRDLTNWLEGFATEAEDAGFLTSFLLLLKRHKLVSALLLLSFFLTVFSFIKISQNESRAVASEKLAQANEKKATETLALYRQEKKLTEQMGQHAVKQLAAINEYHLQNMKFDSSVDFINATLKYEPGSPVLNALKGETLFYQQKYSEAYWYLKKSGFQDKPFSKLMLKWAPDLAALKAEFGFIPAKDFARLYKSMDKKQQERIWAYETAKFASLEKYREFLGTAQKLNELKNHLDLCRLLLAETEEHVLSEGLNFKYSLEQDGIVLDLSNNTGLEHGNKVRHLALKTLNLENTRFWHRWIFSHYHLQNVNIVETGFKKIDRGLAGNDVLKTLTLSKEQRSNSSIGSGVTGKIKLIIK